MKPLEYLEYKKEDILFNLTNNNNYTVGQADGIFQTIHILIQKLTLVRNSEALTNKILSEIDSMSETDMRTIKHWLLEAFKSDNTFKYAYNCLARFWNRDPGAFLLYNLIDIPEEQLYLLIQSENHVQENDGIKAKIIGSSHADGKVKLTGEELEKLIDNLKEYINFGSISKFNDTINALNNSKMLLGNKNIEFAAIAIILHKAFCKKTVEFNYWLSTIAEEVHRDFTNYKPADPQLTKKRENVLIKYPFLDNLS